MGREAVHERGKDETDGEREQNAMTELSGFNSTGDCCSELQLMFQQLSAFSEFILESVL